MIQTRSLGIAEKDLEMKKDRDFKERVANGTKPQALYIIKDSVRGVCKRVGDFFFYPFFFTI